MDGDAEWIDVDKEFGTPTRRPRPTFQVPRGRTTPVTEEGPHEAPEVYPRGLPEGDSVTSNAVIVGSVVGALAVCVIAALVVLLIILRKRLVKVNAQQQDSDYNMRVCDVAHLNLDDLSNPYVNTTDIQKLLSSVRAKSKSPIPPPSKQDHGSRELPLWPDIVKVTYSAEGIQQNNTDKVFVDDRNIKSALFSTGPSPCPVNSSQHLPISLNKSSGKQPPVTRPAPPPPPNTEGKERKLITHQIKLQQEQSEQDATSWSSCMGNHTAPVSSVMPSVKSFPCETLSHCEESLGSKQSPSSNLKPLRGVHGLETKKPSPPPVSRKPQNISNRKPLLPPLKIKPPVPCDVDSGYTTPETASTYVGAEKTPDLMADQEDPVTLSVSARKALIEAKIK